MVLTARDETRGKDAVAKLETEGLKPKFFKLDIESSAEREALRDWLKTNYGGLDVLIQNAGGLFDSVS